MKDTGHPPSHPRVHLGDRVSAEKRGVYLRKKEEFGHGQDTVLGWSDPGFWPRSVANPTRGVAPAQQDCGAGKLSEKGEGGKNCFLHFRLLLSLHLV